MMINFSDHVSNETIVAIPALMPPFTFFDQDDFYDQSIPLFTLCGPIVLLMRELAKQRGAWLKFLNPPRSEAEAFDQMANQSPDFLAYSGDSSMYVKYGEQLKWIGLQAKESKAIDYTDDDRIAARRYPGTTPMFQYQVGLQLEFILALVLVVFIATLFLTRKDFGMKQLMLTYFDIILLLVSKSFPSSVSKSDSAGRCIIGPLILAFLFASIHFCNLILNGKMMTIEDKFIDSFDDLFKWKHLEIVALQGDFMVEYIEQDNEMARDFATRFKCLDIDNYLKEDFLISMATNISTGQAVFLKNRLTMIVFLNKMAFYMKNKDPDFLDKIHLSRYGSTSLPYFIPSFRPDHHPYYRSLNKVITRCQQSGIYSKWKSDAIKIGGYTDRFEDTKETLFDLFRFDDISIVQVQGEFLILIVGFTLAIFALSCEIFIKRKHSVKISFNELHAYMKHQATKKILKYKLRRKNNNLAVTG